MTLSRLQARLLSYVQVTAEGCWIWTGYVHASGYGMTYDGVTNSRAHRVSYQAFVGPIPDGLYLDHLCRTPSCINPCHLEPVTPAENVRRGLRGEMTHCQRGHEFTPENTRRQSSGARQCRICQNAAIARYAKRVRAARLAA